MLTEICAELKNYFCLEKDKVFGDFVVENGTITPSVNLLEGQYYRIVGSVFNDGVHKYDDILTDEPKFHGAIWKMRVPQDVIQLADDVEAWLAKYGGVNSSNMSPYSSESFGGYSYNKAQGYASSSGGMLNTWQAVFGSRLNKYRKIRL